jgi:hypothetical protein
MASMLDVLVGLFGADRVRGYSPPPKVQATEQKPADAATIPRVDMPIETRGADGGGMGMPDAAGRSGRNIVGGTQYGLGGTVLGALMGVPGLGTAGGVGLDVRAANAGLKDLGLPETVEYGPALAAALSMGMFGDSTFDQANTGFMNAYDSRNAAFGPYDNVGGGGGDHGGGWQGSPSAEWSDSNDMGVW